jgi:hypothetical protein
MVQNGASPDTRRMRTCPCPESALTCVRIADAVLLRCSAHDVQRWAVDGRPAERADVLRRLRGVFDERRGRDRSPRPAPRPRVVRLPDPLTGTPEEQLSALLRARGLAGSWSLA